MTPAPVDCSRIFYNQSANGEFETNYQSSTCTPLFRLKNPNTTKPVYCRYFDFPTEDGCTNIPSLSKNTMYSLGLSSSRV